MNYQAAKSLSLFLIVLSFCSLHAQLNFDEHLIVDAANNGVITQSSVAADFDGDGDLDIICKIVTQIQNSNYPSQIWWFENIEGPGNFSVRKLLADDVYGYTEMVPADVDNDGDFDLVINNSRLSWFENLDGQGNFSAIIHIANNQTAGKLAIDNIDDDNLVDIVVGRVSDQSLVWYKNLGGSFSAQELISNTLNGISSLVIDDIDSDGTNDIIATSETANSLYFFKNLDGLGGFGNQEVISTSLIGATSVFSEDLNNDSFPDLLVASKEDNTISWFKNEDGFGNFSLQQIIDANVTNPITAIPIDINQDGYLDIVIGEDNENEVGWYINDTLGSFGTKQVIDSNFVNLKHLYSEDLDNNGMVYIVIVDGIDVRQFTFNSETFANRGTISTRVNSVSYFDMADINGNGFKDVVYSDADKIVWLRNNNNEGDFCCQKTLSFNFDAGPIKTIDFDNDDDLDVLAIDQSEGKLYWFENLNSFGNFGAKQELISDLGWAKSIDVLDLDSDGLQDIIVNSDNLDLSWLKNIDGLGNFDNPAFITSGNFAIQHEFNDIDGDNDLDLLELYGTYDSVNDVSYASIGWRENLDGMGTFGTRTIIIPEGVNHTYSIRLFDIDHDNDLDLLRGEFENISFANNQHSLIWQENTNGLGDFSEDEQVIVSIFAESFDGYSVPFDIDNDNDSDIIFINNTPKWCENINGQGDFAPYQTLFTADFKTDQIFPIDVDNDGDLDLVKIDRFPGFIYWLENPDITLSLEESVTNKFKLYPNPTKNKLNVKSEQRISNLAIYSQIGQLVLENTDTNSIDVSGLSNGIYFIQIKDISENTEVKQFIKN